MFGNAMSACTNSHVTFTGPPWRNWLARSAVNRKVGGSSPPGGAIYFDKFYNINKKSMFTKSLLTLAGLEPAIP